MSASSSKPPLRRTYGRRVAPPSPPRQSMLFTPPPSSPSRLSSPLPDSSPIRAPKRVIMDSDPIDDLPSPKRARPLGVRDDNLPANEPSSTSSVTPVAMESKAVKLKETRQATLASFFGPIKRRVRPSSPSTSTPSSSAPSSSSTSTSTSRRPSSDKSRLTQLHFMHGAQRTCTECGMSYMRGGEDDRTHASHHARVTRGIPFPKSRSDVDAGGVSWKGGYARLLVVDGKWDEVYSTVDNVLSASPLTAGMRSHCKLVLAVTSSSPPISSSRRKVKEDGKERIVGVVVAQPIKHAMRVLNLGEDVAGKVDSGGGVVCDPTPLPTPLGIHRLFVVPAYRGCGLARAMLDAAANTTVYGCRFDPVAGEVAFSQPTESGRAVMQAWGRGGVRVFDEGQL